MRLITAFLISITFASCAAVNVVQVHSDLNSSSDAYIYENDSVKITYHFWDENGRMQFDIYNKLSFPLYVDWKISAYIPNDKMVSYWRDETNTEAVSAGYYYRGIGATSSKIKAVRMERIGVIPPMSMITQESYYLVKKDYVLPSSGTYDKEKSPLRFRNYVMIANNEKFEGKVSSIDNSFYVSFIKKTNSNKFEKYKSNQWFYTKNKY